jgi:hypothetical protein
VNWLSKRVNIKPTLLVGVLLAVLIGSAGIAYAVTVNSLTSTQLWPGEATIVNAPNLSVTDYELIYSSDLTQVESINVTLTNGDAGNPHTADVDLAAGNTAETVIESGSETSWSVGAGSSDTKTITLSNPLDLDNLDWVNIIVDQTS